MLEITDGYTAFCIDEAATFVMGKLKSGEVPLSFSDNRQTAKILMEGGF